MSSQTKTTKTAEEIRRSLELSDRLISELTEHRERWLDQNGELCNCDGDTESDPVSDREWCRFSLTYLGVARIDGTLRLAVKTDHHIHVHARGSEDAEATLHASSEVVPVVDASKEVQEFAFDAISDLLAELGGEDRRRLIGAD
jgi:hypothetical protein